jgi:hypothetical protein
MSRRKCALAVATLVATLAVFTLAPSPAIAADRGFAGGEEAWTDFAARIRDWVRGLGWDAFAPADLAPAAPAGGPYQGMATSADAGGQDEEGSAADPNGHR